MNPKIFSRCARVVQSLIASGLGLALAGAAEAQPAAGWQVRAVGVRIVAATPDDDLRAFHHWPGTTLSLLLTSPGGGDLLGLVEDESRIAIFTDDLGADLLRGSRERTFFAREGIREAGRAKDGSALLLEVQGPGLPGREAKMMNVQGTIVVRTAKGKEKVAAENVALKNGTQFKIGDTSLTLSGVQPGHSDMTIEIKANQDLSHIAEFEFFTSDGKKIEATSWGSMTSRFGTGERATVETSQTYKLEGAAGQVRIVATCWTGVEVVEVPVKLSAGIGL